MSRNTPMLVLVTVATLAGCTTATPSPAPTAPPTAVPTAAATVFTSTLYPYSITLPPGWVAVPAVDKWSGTDAPTSEETTVDKYIGGGTSFGSAAPTKSSLDQWVQDGIATNFRFHSDTCPEKPDAILPITIGGQPGKLVALNCGLLINTAYTVAKGYGYRFGFRDSRVHAATDPADLATFTTLLASVVFR